MAVPVSYKNSLLLSWPLLPLPLTILLPPSSPADDPPLHLGRESEQDCAGGLRCPNCPPFQETVMDATGRNETFVANVGPTGNQRGYMAIASECTMH